MAVTLAEIAALAGVSRGTVDRALNDRGRVDPKVAARVRRIAAERGYRPNRAGRMLARAKNPIRIGVIVQSVETMFMHTVFEEIERASAHFTTTGAEVLVRPLEGVDAQQQLDVIDELLEAGVQGIALSPAEDERVRARIQELSERMPVVTFNSDLPDSRRLCFVGQDIYKAGRVAGGLMSRCVPAGSQLLATVGNLKFDGHRQRLAGFRDRIREAGFPMEDLVVAETFNDYETTFRVVTEAIDRYPRLRGIYMANLSVSGCAAAIEQAGKKGAIRLICHDLNESVRQLLLRGSIDFTIPQNLRQQGYGPLILLRDILRRKAVPDAARFNRQIDIVCSDNLP